MSRFRAWIQRLIQRIAGVWYEGPNPPNRISASVEAFALNNPVAVREQWAAFAISMAEESYKAGYRRGYEDRVDDQKVALKEGVVVPMTQHDALWEQAVPHRLDTEEHMTEKVEVFAAHGQLMKAHLEKLQEKDPELSKKEEEYWRGHAGMGPSRR